MDAIKPFSSNCIKSQGIQLFESVSCTHVLTHSRARTDIVRRENFKGKHDKKGEKKVY